MKVYITKYAMTTGIYEADAEYSSVEGMIRVKRVCHFQYFSGQDWHTNKESAIKRAEEMKKKKIISLKKQLRKIQALTFE